MVQQTEGKLVERIQRNLRTKYPSSFWTKIHGSAYQRAGLPDIIGCHQGRFVAFEVKVPGKEHTVTALQRYTLEELTKAGALAEMITSVEEAEDYLKGLDGVPPPD